MAEGSLPEVETREIPGFGGYYRAGIDGSVWSCRQRGASKGQHRGSVADRVDNKWRRIYGRPHARSGHLEIKIRKPGEPRKYWKAHQLILFAFVGPMPLGMECRHLNGNPADNRLENLVWGTRQENVHDAIRHGTFCPRGFKRNQAAHKYDDIEAEIQRGATTRQIRERFNVPMWVVMYAKKRLRMKVA